MSKQPEVVMIGLPEAALGTLNNYVSIKTHLKLPQLVFPPFMTREEYPFILIGFLKPIIQLFKSNMFYDGRLNFCYA